MLIRLFLYLLSTFSNNGIRLNVQTYYNYSRHSICIFRDKNVFSYTALRHNLKVAFGKVDFHLSDTSFLFFSVCLIGHHHHRPAIKNSAIFSSYKSGWSVRTYKLVIAIACFKLFSYELYFLRMVLCHCELCIRLRKIYVVAGLFLFCKKKKENPFSVSFGGGRRDTGEIYCSAIIQLSRLKLLIGIKYV